MVFIDEKVDDNRTFWRWHHILLDEKEGIDAKSSIEVRYHMVDGRGVFEEGN